MNYCFECLLYVVCSLDPPQNSELLYPIQLLHLASSWESQRKLSQNGTLHTPQPALPPDYVSDSVPLAVDGITIRSASGSCRILGPSTSLFSSLAHQSITKSYSFYLQKMQFYPCAIIFMFAV